MSTATFSNLYADWLKENIQEKQIDKNIFRISTPFLDRKNDYIEVYIIKDREDSFIITDDGYTVGELELSGFNLESSKRRMEIFNTILNSHGISIDDDKSLYVRANLSNYPAKKHMLTQCMMKVSDLFVLSQSNVKSLFIEDVKNFFEQNNIRYTEGPSFIGKSKLLNNFDFVISHYKDIPERIIGVVNNYSLDYAKSIIFSWEDIKEVRSNNPILYTFINDTVKVPSKEALQALSEYDIKYVLWSQRDKYIKELSA